MNGANIEQRFVGTIVGAAVGDALGAPFEGWSAAAMKDVPDLFDGYRRIGAYPSGQYTDDTQLTLALAESLINRRGVDGADIAEKYADLWRTGTIVGQGASCHEAMMKLISGRSDWTQCGSEEGRAGNGTAMRVSPIGLWDCDSREDIPRHAEVSSIITHKDPRATAGAIAVAAAVAYCINYDGFLVRDFLHRISALVEPYSEEFAGHLVELGEWMKLNNEEDTLYRIAAAGWRRPEDRLDYITPFVIPTVLMALYAFMRSPDDYCRSVERAIRAGGDVDTTGAITGAISGAFNGIEAIPAHLVSGLKDSEYIQSVATRLFEAKQG